MTSVRYPQVPPADKSQVKKMDNLLRWTQRSNTWTIKEKSPGTEDRIYLSEIISALSFALDLTEGAVPGHALRCCLLGMRMAREIGLGAEEMCELYYALLLKDVGCSSNAARLCEIIGGDDRAVKSGVKLEDWTQTRKPRLSTLRLLWENVLPGSHFAERVARVGKIALSQRQNSHELISIRCDRGAEIIRKLGLPEPVAQAVRSLDEHWDGCGYPDGSRGEHIPLLSRILAVAQHLDVFAGEVGPEQAITTLQHRSGRWFDPELVRIATSLDAEHRLWSYCMPDDDRELTRQLVLLLDPGEKLSLPSDQIDRICEVFADVVDAKSPFTYRHSIGVADAALAIAHTLGLAPERVNFVHRAALLHDLGKLRVPNSILDKPGRLTLAERLIIEEHPALTQSILERVAAFRELAVIAAQHHERLDGSGYPNCLTASQLSLEARIIAVADVYGALSEERPYRRGLPLEQIVTIMSSDLPNRLDPECFKALQLALTQGRVSA